MDEQDRHDAGMKVRREVLGNAHVDRAQAKKSELTTEFQDMITRYAWGEIWTRPGLPRHTRSLMTICMMVALNREEELKLHLRAASNNGVSRDEMFETFSVGRGARRYGSNSSEQPSPQTRIAGIFPSGRMSE